MAGDRGRNGADTGAGPERWPCADRSREGFLEEENSNPPMLCPPRVGGLMRQNDISPRE